MNQADITTIFAELIGHLGLDVSADITQDGDVFLVNLTGKDTKFLEKSKDNRGGALVALVKLIAKKRFDQEPRIILDFYHQRKERLDNIAQIARKKAEMVRVRGEEEEMPPMTPAERRIVHMTLKEMSGIRTESRGVEPHRRIVILLDDSSE